MKKKISLPTLARLTVFLSPFMLIGCQTIDGLFGDSSRYEESYGKSQYHRNSPSSAKPSPKVMSTSYKTEKNAAQAEAASTTTEASASASANPTANKNTVKVPVAPATDMVAPTVDQ